MRAYKIIQQYPEWVTSERTPRAAIQDEARRYVRELEGSKNFSSLITEDLDDLLRQRDATNDFAGVVADGNTAQANTDSTEYLTDRRKAQIYAIFVKAVISELSGKAICTAAQIEKWRERYAVKLERLQAQIDKAKRTVRELKPIADLKAEMIYTRLKDLGYIDCNVDAFLWHFGERKNRAGKPAPDLIKWKEKTENQIFAYCCSRISQIAVPGNHTNWKGLQRHFSPNPEMNWNWEKANDQLRNAKDVEMTNEEIIKLKNFFDDIKDMEKKEEIKRAKEEGRLLGRLEEQKRWNF